MSAWDFDISGASIYVLLVIEKIRASAWPTLVTMMTILLISFNEPSRRYIIKDSANAPFIIQDK
jgi:hypothetical protein